MYEYHNLYSREAIFAQTLIGLDIFVIFLIFFIKHDNKDAQDQQEVFNSLLDNWTEHDEPIIIQSPYSQKCYK